MRDARYCYRLLDSNARLRTPPHLVGILGIIGVDTASGAVWDGSDVQKASNDNARICVSNGKPTMLSTEMPNNTKQALQPPNPPSRYHSVLAIEL